MTINVFRDGYLEIMLQDDTSQTTMLQLIGDLITLDTKEVKIKFDS